MKITFINGSPKKQGSSSGNLINALRGRLSDTLECIAVELAQQSAAEIIDAVQNCDVIVFVFPLYVDGLPSGLVRFLDEYRSAVANAAPCAKVYAVANCGFYEARQNAIAITMVENFCASSGLTWGRGLGIGCGGMPKDISLNRFPMKKVGRAMDEFAQSICGLETAESSFVEPSLPRFLYLLLANLSMKLEMRRQQRKLSSSAHL